MTQPEDVGSLADEAVKLAGALLGDAEYREHASTCRWCPRCQFVDAVRNNPAAIEQFVGMFSLLLRTGRTFLDTAAGPPKDTR